MTSPKNDLSDKWTVTRDCNRHHCVNSACIELSLRTHRHHCLQHGNITIGRWKCQHASFLWFWQLATDALRESKCDILAVHCPVTSKHFHSAQSQLLASIIILLTVVTVCYTDLPASNFMTLHIIEIRRLFQAGKGYFNSMQLIVGNMTGWTSNHSWSTQWPRHQNNHKRIVIWRVDPNF
jgi:hypothetical protein